MMKKHFFFFLMALYFFACEANNLPSKENCSDQIDNDLDGFIDCWDPDCQSNAVCKQGENLCGNGIKEENEACDMHDFGAETCFDHGYTAGQLYCSSHCSISLSACTLCGNGECEAGETKETCPFDCNEQQGAICGNGIIEFGEQCDGFDLNGQSCLSLQAGYNGGILRCAANCVYEYSACEFCGNQECEATETVENCLIDCSSGNNICGNGNCEAGETQENCPLDCEAENYYCGDGICSLWEDSSTCPADCSNPLLCGNSIINNGEECDSTNLNGQTCQSLGYGGGALACDAICRFNKSSCWTCGNGLCESVKGENQSNCSSDCGGSCFSGDIEVTVTSGGNLEIHGTTGVCGNHPYTWGIFSSLVGDEVLFNVNSPNGWLIWWEGSSCSATNLRWNLIQVNIAQGINSACWAVCNGSGPNLCCSYSGQFPSICGNGTEEKIFIFATQNL